MDETQALEKIELLRLAFKELAEEELREIAALTEFHTYPAEHVLCHEGAYEDVFYIVAAGNIVVSMKMGEEEEGERVIRAGGRGDLVGEMALIQNAPRSATVKTTTECIVLEMEKQDFETILRRSPRMAIDIIRITLDRIRANDRMMIADLQKTNKVLRQLDRNKLEFIQVAAHELRTPLTVVNGYSKVLRSFSEIAASHTMTEVVDGIIKGADRIHEVVNTMLDVTRIDVDALKVASVPVPLKRIIDDVIHGLTNAAEERKIVISTDYADGVSTINGDPALVQKALYHLIVNAIKYTPDGGKVSVSACPATLENDTPGVEIAIKDTGIGLDAEHHSLVFEKFYQVGSVAIHSSGRTTFKGGGAGLGLAIVRGVARSHGGKVWVESPGHDEVNFPGSTFHLLLPLNPPRPEPPAQS
ncbi:MAG: ATP-binding protein [Chloroflexota bacterium]